MNKDWLHKKTTQKIIAALGGGDKARFVGGCVRNTVLGLPVADIDIATIHPPEETVRLCATQGIKTIPTGIAHGTVTALLDKETFEITTLRRDIKTNGRHAQVVFSTDWTEDAQRRDFTMNTLLMDAHGSLYDPLGNGLADAQARRVIFVGDPAQRIREDVLRILRFFRFHAYYGAGEADSKALAACAAHAHLIPSLSRERITQEYLKIHASENAAATLKLMKDHNVLPELAVYDIPHFDQLETMARLTKSELSAREKYLILSSAQKKQIASIEKAVREGRFDSEENIQKTIYYHGREATRAAYLLTIEKIYNKHIQTIDFFDSPTFPLTGEDLIAQGYEQGPQLGQKLAALEKEWVENGFRFK